MSFDPRIGVAGLIVGVVGVGITILWPRKWVGWTSIGLALLLGLGWTYREVFPPKEQVTEKKPEAETVTAPRPAEPKQRQKSEGPRENGEQHADMHVESLRFADDPNDCAEWGLMPANEREIWKIQHGDVLPVCWVIGLTNVGQLPAIDPIFQSGLFIDSPRRGNLWVI
jgi:hypothetical protein